MKTTRNPFKENLDADDRRLPQVVEQRRLSVVDVTDDGANGRPRYEVFQPRRRMDDVVTFLFFGSARLLPRIRNEVELAAKLFCQLFKDEPEKSDEG